MARIVNIIFFPGNFFFSCSKLFNQFPEVPLSKLDLMGPTTNSLSGVLFRNSGTLEALTGAFSFGNLLYTQTNGVLSFGLSSPTDFGRCVFAGQVALTGTLRVLPLNYTPSIGDCFGLIAYGSQTGCFTGFDLPTNMLHWQTHYDPNLFTLCVVPTGSNAPPRLILPLSVTMNELTAFIGNVGAIDSDVPPNKLTLELITGPTNLTFNGTNGVYPTNGVIAWTPTEAQGPVTTDVFIRVFDDGTPSLSTTQSFQITVHEVNTAPVLDPIANRSVHFCQTASLTAHAADADLPTNTLTFTLLTPPPGASIGPSTGAFSWMPSQSNVGNSFTIRVKATDNGSPNLSATQTFNISVLSSAPELQIAITNDVAFLSWNACPGTNYRVQFKPDLNLTNWTDLDDVFAFGDTATKTNAIGGQTNRFYRVQMLP